MIAHVVLFTPRASLGRAEEDALIASLQRACSDIPQIRRVRVGRRRALGYAYDTLSPLHFEFSAVIEFDSEDDLRAYLQHPAHASLGQHFTSAVEAAIVHDFEIVEPARVRDIASRGNGA